jgi:hypothetical protein
MLLDPDPHSQYGSGSSDGIFRQSIGARNRVGIGLSHRPARLHRLAESIPGIHKRLKIPAQDSQINATGEWIFKPLFLGLYAGTVPSLAANIAENSILFMAYGGCQKMVAAAAGVSRTEELTVLQNGFSGFLAAFWSSLALCPTELVKCR